MKILGLSFYYHDSAAALVEDGGSSPPPRRSASRARSTTPVTRDCAIDFCLEARRHHRRRIDYVVFYEKPFVKFERMLTAMLAAAFPALVGACSASR